MNRKTLTGRTIGGLSLHVLCRRIEVASIIIFPQEYLRTLSPESAVIDCGAGNCILQYTIDTGKINEADIV